MTRMTETLPDLTYRYSTLPGRIVKHSIFKIKHYYGNHCRTHTRLSESREQNYIDSLCQHSNMLTDIFTDMKLINL